MKEMSLEYRTRELSSRFISTDSPLPNPCGLRSSKQASKGAKCRSGILQPLLMVIFRGSFSRPWKITSQQNFSMGQRHRKYVSSSAYPSDMRRAFSRRRSIRQKLRRRDKFNSPSGQAQQEAIFLILIERSTPWAEAKPHRNCFLTMQKHFSQSIRTI